MCVAVVFVPHQKPFDAGGAVRLAVKGGFCVTFGREGGEGRIDQSSPSLSWVEFIKATKDLQSVDEAERDDDHENSSWSEDGTYQRRPKHIDRHFTAGGGSCLPLCRHH